MPINSGSSNEKKGFTSVANKQNNADANSSSKSGKQFLTISPVLPCLPAIPKRHKLQHRSHSTLSVGDADMLPCSSVNLQVTEDGIIQVNRSQKEREKYPDRLHLDRRGLTSIPQLVDEGQIRFLSLQHNQLIRIDNISSLQLNHLVFLDLYDNQLENMNGISELTNLRVLLMGKNRIRRIEGLSTLLKLEVMDLHGNQVSEINGLTALRELKVLNLASNLIRVLRSNDLKGLQSLQELNLRKNKIRSIMCFKDTAQLVKLYLSNNDIQSLEDLNNLVSATSLKELTIDGNPVSLSSECVSYLVSHLPFLHLISNMQVTDQMRKAATAWRTNKYGPSGVANPERVGDAERQGDGSVPETTKKCAGSEWAEKVKNVWEESKLPLLGTELSAVSESDDNEQSRADPSQTQKTGTLKTRQKPAGGDYLIEITGRALSVYGQGALRFIDRPWNPVKAGDVTTVKFNNVIFNSLASVLNKVKLRFPNAEHFHFTETNIYCLGQLNALSDIQGLTSLTIEPEGNPIFEKQWRSYAIYRLSHWGLKVINHLQITETELVNSESEFRGLSELVIDCLPDTLLEPLLERLHLGQSIRDPREWLELAEPAIRAVVAKEALQWKKNKQEDAALKQRGKAYFGSIIDSTISAIVKLRLLREEWPAILHEIIRDTLVDYSHIDTYMKQCMSRIKL